MNKSPVLQYVGVYNEIKSTEVYYIIAIFLPELEN